MKKIALLATGHGLNDCISGFILAGLIFKDLSNIDLGVAVLIYNIVAFGGQVPLAWMIKKNYHPKSLLVLSYVLHISSFLWLLVDYKLAILSIGIASSLIHVVGGYECKTETHQAKYLGVFASPGVIGLALGGILGAYQINIILPCILLAVLLLTLTALTKFNTSLKISPSEKTGEPDQHDIAMILLLTIISFRSAIWNIFQIIYEQNFEMLIFIGLSAMLGKLLGGYLADYFGRIKYTMIALILSIPFLTLLKNHTWGLCSGIFLLQSSLPATTALMIEKWKNSPYMGVACSFGLPIILGALLFYTPARNILNNDWIIAGLTALSILLIYIAGRKKKELG